MQRRLGLARDHRLRSGGGGDQSHQGAVARQSSARRRHRGIAVGCHPPRTGSDGQRRLGKHRVVGVGCVALNDRSRPVLSRTGQRQSRFQDLLAKSVATGDKDARAGGQPVPEQPSRCLRRGHHVGIDGLDAELAQMGGDVRRRTQGVVRDEGSAHAELAGCFQRLGGARHRRAADVDHAVEVEQSHVVRRGERLRAPQQDARSGHREAVRAARAPRSAVE